MGKRKGKGNDKGKGRNSRLAERTKVRGGSNVPLPDVSREEMEQALLDAQLKAFLKEGRPLTPKLQFHFNRREQAKREEEQAQDAEKQAESEEKALAQLRAELAPRFGPALTSAITSPGCLVIGKILESEKA